MLLAAMDALTRDEVSYVKVAYVTLLGISLCCNLQQEVKSGVLDIYSGVSHKRVLLQCQS